MPKPNQSCRKQSSAFTLIELLVVISIISLLVAILLPALASARKTAEKIQCGNQIRQLFLGMNMYAVDNKQYILPHRTNMGVPETYWCRKPGITYQWGVNLYITDPNVYLCPTTPLEPFSDAIYTTYAINNIQSTNPNGDTFSPFQLSYLPGYSQIRLEDLHSAGQTIAFIDAWSVSYAPTLSQWGTSTTSNVGYWHIDAANAVMADGHVETVKEEQSTDLRWYEDVGLTFRTKTGL